MGASAVTLLCLAIILSCAPPSIDAQTCEAFAGTPSYCCGYVNYDVLIPPGQNQSLIAATLLQELPETILPFITGDCKTYTLLMSCGLAFRKCNSTDPLAAPPLPMCTDTCNTFNSVCAEQLKLGGKPPRNCSTEIDPFSGALLYQTGASCANPNPPPACPDGPTKVTSCATYFVPNLEGTDCVPGCRFPPFHDKKRNAITQNIFRYITPFSILLELVLVATWLVIWDPKRPLYVAFFMAGLFAQHCAFFIGKWYSFEDWQCINEREYRTQANTGCAIQGFFALIGTYTPIAWIGVILYHLFNSVTQQRYQIFGDGKLIPIDPKYVYHILVWVLIGLLLTVIPFFQNRINARAGYVCYPDIAVDDSKYLYGLLFSPLTVMVVVEIILTIVLFVFIIRLAGVSGLKTQGRLTALCIYYLWCTSYLIFNAWNVFRNRHDTADKIRDHVTCVVANFQRGWTTNDTVGCPPAPVWNDNKELFGDVLVSSTGLVIGLILLDPRFLKHAYDVGSGRSGSAVSSSSRPS